MGDIRQAISYNDCLLVPRSSDLLHLNEANIIYKYDHFDSYPIINAPMDSICSAPLLNCLNRDFNLPVTIHRWFETAKQQIEFFESCGNLYDRSVFVAVGSVLKWEGWIEKLIHYQIKTEKKFGYLVDMANGDTESCVKTVKYLKDHAFTDCNIMAGNVATRSGFDRLQEAGANFIRVGIGGGSICSTRQQCGFGIPTLTSVIDCAKVKETAFLIADGGIESPGDIAKSIACGADMVMLGKMLAATNLSAGEKLDKDKNSTTKEEEYYYVKYRGMASKEAIQHLNSVKSSVSVEGVSGLIRYKGTTSDVMNGILGNLRSSVGYYGGCRTLKEFQRKVKIIQISQQGWEESKTRVE